MKEYLERKGSGDNRVKSNIVYKLTRKILVACYQHIVYKEYLPLVIGSDLMSEFDLWNRVDQESDYDDNVDASMMNEFSTFSYRFGHSLVRGELHMMAENDAHLSSEQSHQLADVFFDTHMTKNEKDKGVWW